MSRSNRLDAGGHLLLYDGVCGLCDSFVRFVLTHDHRCRFRFAALQSRIGRDLLGAHHRDPDRLETVYVVADYESGTRRLLNRSSAVLFVFGQLGWPWHLLTVLRWAPASLLDWLYDRVAAYRYRIFGRHAACPVRNAEHRDRFLDA